VASKARKPVPTAKSPT